ncbi:MAG: hypothetical protein U9N63_05955 [Pseudomonadota bacterium]|nr:hypothetical protein [Pseudomonadota bacterium]
MALLEMMDALNEAGNYRVLYVNIETAQTARGDVERGMATVCSAFCAAAEYYLADKRPFVWLYEIGKTIPADERFINFIRYWCQSDKNFPTVLFIDEADALIGDTLISLLRQIRSGYNQRPEAFPQSVVLCGLRDIRDCRVHSGNDEPGIRDLFLLPVKYK